MQVSNGKGTIFPGFFHQLLQRRIAGIFETSEFDMTHSLRGTTFDPGKTSHHIPGNFILPELGFSSEYQGLIVIESTTLSTKQGNFS
jgi:hypothetical protein